MTNGSRWESVFERAMSMDDRVWMRHANPWSAWTRVATAPFLFAAIWSHVWIGWWSLAPVGVLMIWIWINPRAFPEPKRTDSWASRGVFGERIWINRRRVPIPAHHQRAAQVCHVAGLLLLGIAVYGFVIADVWAAAFGFFGMVAAKMWFVDRMVWLHQDMQDATPAYQSWRRGDA